MRLHTDTITLHQLHAAVSGIEGVYLDSVVHGSRTRDHAFDVRLYADERKGRRRSNTGNYGAGDFAATWDEWGIFFARLFAIDPDMTCYAYDGAEDYHWQTADRFRTEDFVTHDQHRWVFNGNDPDDSDEVWLYSCTCGAAKRYRAARRSVSS